MKEMAVTGGGGRTLLKKEIRNLGTRIKQHAHSKRHKKDATQISSAKHAVPAPHHTILSEHDNDLRIGKAALLDLEMKAALRLGHRRVRVALVVLHLLGVVRDNVGDLCARAMGAMGAMGGWRGGRHSRGD